MELEIIRFIQRIRIDFLDNLFNILTELGDQYIFIVIVIIYYWFVNKEKGFKLTLIFLLSSAATSIIKPIVKRPRPYMEDESLAVIRKTGGYSFPSGHSQAIAIETKFIYEDTKQKYKQLKWILLFLVTLVPFTRMYLGQHYLTDVIGGLLLGLSMYYLGNYLFKLMKNKEEIYSLTLSIVLSIVLLVLLFFNLNFDKYFKIYAGVFGLLGFSVGYFIEKRYIKYEVGNTLINQLYKLFIGGIGILIIELVFKLIPIKTSLHITSVKYLLLGLWISIGSIYLFKKVVPNDKKII